MTQERRTVDQPRDPLGMIKPGEVIDIDRRQISLTESRIFNRLIANAMNAENLGKPHVISKRDLLLSGHQSTDELRDALNTLQRTVVKVPSRRPSDNTPVSLEVQLLGGIERELSKDRNATLVYHLDPVLQKIISTSDHWARLRWNVMAKLKSKYALALYELVAKRINLRHRLVETFDLERLRQLIGIPNHRLTTAGNCVNHALKPAVDRVNALAEFSVAYELKRTGRKITHVSLAWWMKDGQATSERY